MNKYVDLKNNYIRNGLLYKLKSAMVILKGSGAGEHCCLVNNGYHHGNTGFIQCFA